MITVTIGGVDRTSLITFGSLVKRDNINQVVDTLDFSILYHAGQTYRPATNAEVVVQDGAVVVFAGKIYSVTRDSQDKGKIIYQVKAKDYSYDLDRVRIIEEYNGDTVKEILDDIIATINAEAGTSFTTTNVVCDFVITKISFNRITATESIQRLAEITSYNWYIDSNKDLHFFVKNTELSPFNLADGDGNFITDSLNITDDFSQIRNRVFIKGGEVEGDQRTEKFNGDGVKLQFKLSNKFAHLPTVTVGGTPKTVGVDFLDNDADFDCFWDFNNTYIRFKDTTVPPSGTNNIEVTGIPLYNLVMQVQDDESIAEFGLFEFADTNKNLLSRDEVLKYAEAQLQAYANGVIEGAFESYTSGLRSGQVIHVGSTLLDVDEDFLIQRVQFKMLSPNQGVWSVQLATLRTIGIIDFLIALLRKSGDLVGDQGTEVLEKAVFSRERMTMGEVVEINTDDYPQSETMEMGENFYDQALDFDIEFVLGPYIHDPSDGADKKRVFVLNNSRLGPIS